MRRSRNRGWLGGQSADEAEVQVSETIRLQFCLLRVRRVSLKVAWQPRRILVFHSAMSARSSAQSPLAAHGYYKIPARRRFHLALAGSTPAISATPMRKAFYLFWGRKKDMVKSGGISIYPLEIESVIYSHPDILEAAVIGVPDPQWGEALKAVIVLKPGGKLDSVELLSFCKERLAAYKVTKSVELVESLPHTEVAR